MKTWIISVTLALVFVTAVTCLLAMVMPTSEDILPYIKTLVGA